MTSTQLEQLETTLLEVVNRLAKTAETAAEVEALAAVARVLIDAPSSQNPLVVKFKLDGGKFAQYVIEHPDNLH